VAPYRDRPDAGRRLAADLAGYLGSPVTVLAVPRGGVPVASVVADRLAAPLDVLVVRKIGAPGNVEYGIGAVAEGVAPFLDRAALRELGLRPADLDVAVRSQTEGVDRLVRRFRGSRPPPEVEGRVAILVDDGMATGGTVRLAARALRRRRPGRLVVAVGVSSKEAIDALRPIVDEVVCPLVPPELLAVGEWYREFPQVGDDEVVALLARHAGRVAPAVPGP